MFEQTSIFDILLFTIAVYGAYCAGLYAIQKLCHISVQEAKALFWQRVMDGLPGVRLNLMIAEETIAEILDIIVQFSAISRKNTILTFNNYSKIPFLCIEILDPGFMEHWAVIESNIYRSFRKLFSYAGVYGLAYVTFERTVTQDLYRIVVYWATTPRSKKALEKMRSNIIEYNRQMDMEKNAPFIDQELEKEMEDLEDGRKNQTGL